MAKKKVVRKRAKKKITIKKESSPKKKVVRKKVAKKRVVKKKSSSKRKVVKKKAPKRKTTKKRKSTPKTVSLTGVFKTRNKIKPTSLGLALAAVAALMTLLVSLLSRFGYMQTMASKLAECRFFYSPKLLGILLGSLESAVYAFFIGALIAWLYNMFAK